MFDISFTLKVYLSTTVIPGLFDVTVRHCQFGNFELE